MDWADTRPRAPLHPRPLLVALPDNQGAYSKLAPAAKAEWTVRWFLRKLEASVSVSVGSADLLRMVRAMVNG